MRAAFYDLDGTLVASNVVSRYFYFARRAPGLWDRLRRSLITVVGIPYWLYLDSRSRALFNTVFYRCYGGLRSEWLAQHAAAIFENEMRPKLYAGAKALVEADRRAGFSTVLVTGGLDFEMAALVADFGFDHLLANRLRFVDGVATGEVEPPLLAEEGKVKALEAFIRRYNVDTAQSKAYSDSFSDLPMLELVGRPAAVHPDKRLRAAAEQRSWPILNLK